LDAQSPTTRQSYRNRVDNQILPAMGELRLRELTTGTVDRFLKTVAKCSGPSMAKTTRSVLSGMCGLAARHDAIDRNPVRDAQVISQPRKAAPVSLTVKEVRQLRALMTYDDKAVERDLPEFVSFMLATGLRIGEASAVTWAALDLDAGRVEVRGTVVRLKGQGLVLMPTTKTSAGMRMLALPSWCVQNRRSRLPRPQGGTAGPVQHPSRPQRQPCVVRASLGHQSRLSQDHGHPLGQCRTVGTCYRRPAGTCPAIDHAERLHGPQDRLARGRPRTRAVQLTLRPGSYLVGSGRASAGGGAQDSGFLGAPARSDAGQPGRAFVGTDSLHPLTQRRSVQNHPEDDQNSQHVPDRVLNSDEAAQGEVCEAPRHLGDRSIETKGSS
jgi:hypothetical protein